MEWRLALNVSNTQALCFGGLRRQPPPLCLQGQQVPWSPYATYLGVVIDRRLNMAGHVKKATTASGESRIVPVAPTIPLTSAAKNEAVAVQGLCQATPDLRCPRVVRTHEPPPTKNPAGGPKPRTQARSDPGPIRREKYDTTSRPPDGEPGGTHRPVRVQRVSHALKLGLPRATEGLTRLS